MTNETSRGLEAYIAALFASLLIALVIVGTWAFISAGFDLPRAEHDMLGLGRIGSSRYWDALLGLFAFPVMLVITNERHGENGGIGEDVCMLSVGAILGFFGALYGVGYRRADFSDASVIIVLTGGVTSIAALFGAVRSFRPIILGMLGICFGISVYLGAASGAVFTLYVASIYGASTLLILRLSRRKQAVSQESE